MKANKFMWRLSWTCTNLSTRNMNRNSKSDVAKEDSGSYTVFTEQVLLASQMTQYQFTPKSKSRTRLNLLNNARIGTPDCLDPSTSIPLAKKSVRSSRTCASFLKGICTEDHWQGFVTESGLDTLFHFGHDEYIPFFFFLGIN